MAAFIMSPKRLPYRWFLLLPLLAFVGWGFGIAIGVPGFNDTPPAGKKYDVIIVPGIPFENGKWDYIMKGRVYWSYYLFKNGKTKNVIYSGSAVYSPYVEAKIMAMYGEALGIPKAHIYMEEKAEHSTENVYYSYQLAKKLRFKAIGLASDPYQTRRLIPFISSRGLHIDPLPFHVDTLVNMAMTDPEIDYEQAYVKDFVSIKKRKTRWQRLLGSLGWYINREEDDR